MTPTCDKPNARPMIRMIYKYVQDVKGVSRVGLSQAIK